MGWTCPTLWRVFGSRKRDRATDDAAKGDFPPESFALLAASSESTKKLTPSPEWPRSQSVRETDQFPNYLFDKDIIAGHMEDAAHWRNRINRK